ncbi:hypothetical protein ACRDU6_19565 [Mycolicibacterium sp. ELW1]|uniref:hypothetical protein n=1 Tax=Mycobacteriaceae TaxID=1762 RepID=UPI0011EE4FDA|nr:hypothetical protein [Mycobacterium sp. ELW1]QEN14574.1 hypothetical protein D3H54_16110 [Mycobacterium sp. ELW1]
MSTGHVVGYVGGLAVVLGVGTAIMASAPAASADASAPSHSAASGTAKSARPTQRANPVASMRPVPTRKVAAPASSVTLLMAASTADPRRTPARAVRGAAPVQAAASTPPPADTVPIDNNNLVIDSEGNTTRISLQDKTTGTQTGTTLVLTGRIAQPPLLALTEGRAVIATSWDTSTTYLSQVAVFDTETGTQTGTTLDFTGSPSVALVGDGLALIGAYRYDVATGGATDFTVLDVSSGDPLGGGLTLAGGPWNGPAVRVGSDRLLVRAVNQNYWAGTATVSAGVLNITTGSQIGHAVSLDGGPWVDPIVNDDGVHVLLTSSIAGASHAAVIDTVAGEQSGVTVDLQGTAGYVLPAVDGVHVLLTTYDGSSSRVAVVDATTGDEAGNTLTMNGRLERPLLSADGVHALMTAYGPDSTEVAVLDTVTGERTGVPLVFSGQVRGPLVNIDGIHALFASSTGNSTQVFVVDSRTGELTGDAVAIDGTMSYVLVDAGQTHALVVTSDGGSTRFTSFDSASGQPLRVSLSFSGELTGWPQPSTAADGTHALFILDDADITRLVLIDISTGAQTGTGLVLPGDPGIQIVSDDGNHTTIVTRTAATKSHGSSTRVAVIDTTTGNQVGVTTRLTGTPAVLPQLSADGHHVVVRTFAGLSANLDTTTGTATTHIAGPPWGLDLEAFALTPIGRVVTAIQTAVATAYLVMVQFVLLGFFWLGGILSQAQNSSPAAPFGNATVAG